jgi:hypothetical protein
MRVMLSKESASDIGKSLDMRLWFFQVLPKVQQVLVW